MRSFAVESAQNVEREGKEDIRPLQPRRDLGQKLIEYRGGMLTLTCEAVAVRRVQAPPARQRRIVRRQLGREPVEFRRRCVAPRAAA